MSWRGCSRIAINHCRPSLRSFESARIAKLYALHAFISAEDGFVGGTRFEVDYAVSLGMPVQIHGENDPSPWIFRHSFPFLKGKQAFFLAWEEILHKIRLELGGRE
jgi:hypothetical protein